MVSEISEIKEDEQEEEKKNRRTRPLYLAKEKREYTLKIKKKCNQISDEWIKKILILQLLYFFFFFFYLDIEVHGRELVLEREVRNQLFSLSVHSHPAAPILLAVSHLFSCFFIPSLFYSLFFIIPFLFFNSLSQAISHDPIFFLYKTPTIINFLSFYPSKYIFTNSLVTQIHYLILYVSFSFV